jgi:hypothetical protein
MRCVLSRSVERAAESCNDQCDALTHEVSDFDGPGPVPGVADGKTPRLEPTYTADLTELADRHQPDTWLLRHTHMPVTLQRGQTRTANVSLGYLVQVEEGKVEAMVQCCVVPV